MIKIRQRQKVAELKIKNKKIMDGDFDEKEAIENGMSIIGGDHSEDAEESGEELDPETGLPKKRGGGTPDGDFEDEDDEDEDDFGDNDGDEG